MPERAVTLPGLELPVSSRAARLPRPRKRSKPCVRSRLTSKQTVQNPPFGSRIDGCRMRTVLTCGGFRQTCEVRCIAGIRAPLTMESSAQCHVRLAPVQAHCDWRHGFWLCAETRLCLPIPSHIGVRIAHRHLAAAILIIRDCLSKGPNPWLRNWTVGLFKGSPPSESRRCVCASSD